MDKITSENLKFSFKKEEKLCSKKVVDELFEKGDSFLCYPLKIVFIKSTLQVSYPAQAAFSVGKKNFKRAVKRNLIKRRMREAYRLNKSVFYSGLGNNQVAVFFIYIGKFIGDYYTIEEAMVKGMNKILKKVIDRTTI